MTAKTVKSRPAATEVRRLTRLLQRWSAPPGDVDVETVPSGAPPLDAALADGGFRRGWLVEWLAAGRGAGAGALALLAAREACRTGGALVIVDRAGTFYPPALAAWGVDLSRTIVALPATDRDEAWAIDQALRCPHAAAVLAAPRRIDDRNFRRWQLAAETSGAMGLLLRPAAARSEPTWSAVRMQVTPQGTATGWEQAQSGWGRAERPPRGAMRDAEFSGGSRWSSPAAPTNDWPLRLELLRSRGPLRARTLHVQLDPRTGDCHETDPRRVVAQLAVGPARDQTA
ncbi:MAG: hypothetical protein KDA44_14905 [Planctomycetales bacterium]|nr:hypothetical protein [Planctomycetales bacterium]